MVKNVALGLWVLTAVVVCMIWRELDAHLAWRLGGSALSLILLGILGQRAISFQEAVRAGGTIFGFTWALAIGPDSAAIWSWDNLVIVAGVGVWALLVSWAANQLPARPANAHGP